MSSTDRPAAGRAWLGLRGVAGLWNGGLGLWTGRGGVVAPKGRAWSGRRGGLDVVAPRLRDYETGGAAGRTLPVRLGGIPPALTAAGV